LIEKLVKAEKLTFDSFRSFGDVIGPQTGEQAVSTDIFSYWDSVARLRMTDVEAGYLVVKSRPFTFAKMERHLKTSEMFIPMEGCSIFPVAAPGSLDDIEGASASHEVRAFIMDGTAAALLKEGVWHWAPFPLMATSSYLVLHRKGTVDTDLDVKDLETSKALTFRLTL
jgi:ureidoglycolate hydrolase